MPFMNNIYLLPDFQGGIAIFYIHAVVFISPNLAGLGCRREYRHDKNTAYSGSLDARRNN